MEATQLREKSAATNSVNVQRVAKVLEMIKKDCTREAIVSEIGLGAEYLNRICKVHNITLPDKIDNKPLNSRRERTYDEEQLINNAIDLLKSLGFKVTPPDPFKGELLKG